jgi:hypothetical protein
VEGDSGGTAVTYLLLGCAGPAGLEFAVRALEDEIVRARMALLAVPEDESGIGFEHLELVGAAVWLGHYCGMMRSDRLGYCLVRIGLRRGWWSLGTYRTGCTSEKQRNDWGAVQICILGHLRRLSPA